MQCFKCGQDGLKPHENWPVIKILIDLWTEAPHRCPVKRGPWNRDTELYPADLFVNGERNPAWHDAQGFFIGRRFE